MSEKVLCVSELVEHVDTGDVGVVIKVNTKTVKVAFGADVANTPKSEVKLTEDKTIEDVKVVKKVIEDVGTFGYVRHTNDVDFTKENLDKGLIHRCVVTNKNRSETSIAVYTNKYSTIATEIYILNVGYVTSFFTQELEDVGDISHG